jgi:Zn finger protein HypA/HybF involved in hydrogenase expression
VLPIYGRASCTFPALMEMCFNNLRQITLMKAVALIVSAEEYVNCLDLT